MTRLSCISLFSMEPKLDNFRTKKLLLVQAFSPGPPRGGDRGDNDPGAHHDHTEKRKAIAAVQATCRYNHNIGATLQLKQGFSENK